MAQIDRGNIQRRGTTTNFISLVGQSTTGLPLSTGGDSFAPTAVTNDGHIPPSAQQGSFFQTLNMPIDQTLDGYSIQESSQILYMGSGAAGGGGGTITPGTTTYYKMQGFFVSGSVYETWIAVNTPNSTPPSGHSLTNICVIDVFTH